MSKTHHLPSRENTFLPSSVSTTIQLLGPQILWHPSSSPPPTHYLINFCLLLMLIQQLSLNPSPPLHSHCLGSGLSPSSPAPMFPFQNCLPL